MDGKVSFLLSLLGRVQKITQEDENKLIIDFGVIAQWQKRERVHIKQKACDDGSIPSHPLWRDTIFNTNLLDICSVITLHIYTPIAQSG